jgi:DNA-binding response OmpR family regulator
MNGPSNRILLIEDDQGLARSITNFLTNHGFVIKHFVNGDNLNHLVSGGGIDLILCDVMLPGTNGFEIAKSIREKFDGPYIFLSALNDQHHQLKGFQLGADDYIGKPVEPELLLARINACLRRKRPVIKDEIITVENLSVDNINRVVKVDQEVITLSRYEFDLLWLLAMQQGQQVSREFLFLNTVGREYDGLDRTVDGRVSRLRKKLEQYINLRCQIETIWGQGYILTCKSL